jgi:hypothetical protein
MKRNMALLFVLLLAAFSLASCSGLPKGGCTINCGGGTSTVSVTVIAAAPPASPSIISFQVTITGITLNSTGGAPVNLTPTKAPVVELMRLQSDSAFYGKFPSITSGTYNSATIAVASPVITFLNNTNATVSGCLPNHICTVTPAAAGSPTITFTAPITLGTTGAGLNVGFNLTNLITVTGGNLNVNFAPTTAALSVVTLPRANSNLGTNQLDLIEDFTGVVSVTGSAVTVQSATRGTLVASTTSNTIYNTSPNGTLCTTSGSGCVIANQVASIDAVLKNDGTLSILEYEPLAPAAQDIVEGTIVSVSSLTQFTIVTSDKIQAASNSRIGSLSVGDPLQVNIPSVNPFLVDTKGLNVGTGFTGLFASATTTDPLRPGQTVAVHVTNFTAASGTTIVSATADTVTLRFSRFTTTASAPFTITSFNITGFPAYFNTTGTLQAQTFVGTPGSVVGTNYDGIADPTGLIDTRPVALRALYIENSTNSATPAFFAAKVRKP